MIKHDHFTGVALVMHKGKIVHARAYGLRGANKNYSITTAFHVASVTKQFTAAAIMQLAEKGLVDLNGSVNNYLPYKYQNPKWNSVTIHHLLTHTSGIEDYAFARPYYHVVKGFCLGKTVDGMIKEAMAKDLQFASGTKFYYTNLGHTLLGLVIENQTKISFDNYIKEHILDPLGMRSSKIHVEGHISSKDEAEGYRFSKEKSIHVPNDEVNLPVTAPDGGLITTLDDFIRWIEIFKNNNLNLLSQDSIKKMMAPAIETGWKGPKGIFDFYGYGLLLGDSTISHMGEIVGFKSFFVYDKKNDMLVVVFSNNTTNDPV